MDRGGYSRRFTSETTRQILSVNARTEGRYFSAIFGWETVHTPWTEITPFASYLRIWNSLRSPSRSVRYFAVAQDRDNDWDEIACLPFILLYSLAASEAKTNITLMPMIKGYSRLYAFHVAAAQTDRFNPRVATTIQSEPQTARVHGIRDPEDSCLSAGAGDRSRRGGGGLCQSTPAGVPRPLIKWHRQLHK